MNPELEIKSFFTALASPLRLALLWHLAESPRTRQELRKLLHVELPVIHNNIRVLQRIGLLERTGRRMVARATVVRLSRAVGVLDDQLEFNAGGVYVLISRPVPETRP